MVQINSLNMLQFLEELMKHGSFTKAAKNIYVSQPYLTQVIKKKETELGIEIIDRQAHPLQLTEAGRVYYQYLLALVNEQDLLKKNLAKYTSPHKLILHIGVLSSLGTYVLPLFIPQFLAKYPEVKIELTEDVPVRNEQRVLNDELDFLVGQNPETLSPQLTSYDRGTHGYYAVIPESSPLYQPGIVNLPAGSLDLKTLLQQKLILTQSGSAIRRQIDYLIQKLDIQPDIILESNNIFTIGKLAQANLGVTFLPESVTLAPSCGHYNLYQLPLDIVSLNYFIAHSNKKTLNTIEKSLINFFLEKIAENI
ncbi:transcription regulator [Lapidilactobacillus dextrinicus DSM 20335]|uniref:Transcription regulator n=1 Tax=Lapidilactobacillus dextrinicus DSM 20335 TaxID=1423738 RepID=A0A0R2BT54_9LACO|nr:LysR family transcriptional regulator [Lapidilactobacillus dextrinicus]KRM78659.1 transcription regulator [Lapidilactobacillus dextrinicus DSM 20335]QFG46590.1 LysR family transcriptional regulator [Lapidilactobacillus dextrinicus]